MKVAKMLIYVKHSGDALGPAVAGPEGVRGLLKPHWGRYFTSMGKF